MKVRFCDSIETIHQLTSVSITPHVITLKGDGISFNSSGFVLYEDDGKTVYKNCRGFKYQYNKYTNYDNGYMTTDIEGLEETDPGEMVEVIDPLSAEEATEAIGDLMFQIDCLTLGI